MSLRSIEWAFTAGAAAVRAIGRWHWIVVVLLLLPAPLSAQTTTPPAQKETIEADVSTRTVAVDTGFTGTRIVVFGTVEHSRQQRADEGLYDVAIVLEGPREPLVTRRKSNVGGIWINTTNYTFKDVPSFYAIVTTRPVPEIAPKPVLWQNGIGFEFLRFAAEEKVGSKELEEFREAIVRLKSEQRLYVESERGVAFIGKSLFRATVDLPATVSIGEFNAWIYLFRKGELLSTYKTRLGLQREGLEQQLHSFAIHQPLGYGLASVALAVLAGLAASFSFRKS
ncbi:MAG: TIGR02186 family protein [Hyphomicrobiaceae bacterium]